MCKLYFNYGTMNSGKSMLLLAKAYNFEERGIPYRIYKSSIDTRDKGVIHSRALGDRECYTIGPKESFFAKCYWYNTDVKWLMVDEAQFLTEKQVDELATIVDECGIDVICYGLRTDFQTHLFPGSKRLFEIADTFEEIKSQCEDGNKNIFNARIDKEGNIVTEGEQIQVGAEDCYKSVSRKMYKRLKDLPRIRRLVRSSQFDRLWKDVMMYERGVLFTEKELDEAADAFQNDDYSKAYEILELYCGKSTPELIDRKKKLEKQYGK